MAEYFYLRFYHKGQFVKNKYLCGKCMKIPVAVEVDRFSFSVLMEYVKDDVGYTEIGGIYVKKQGGGWKLVSSDADVGELVKGLLDGCHLDFYIDTVVDKAIEPVKQMQPHVIMRPRTSFFEGLDKVKTQYVTIHTLQKDQKNKKKEAHEDLNLVGNEKVQSPPEIEGDDINKKKTTKAAELVVNEENVESAAHIEVYEKSKKKLTKKDILADFEEKRKKRVAENNQMLERLRIKKLKADLEDQKTKKKKVEEDIGNISDLEFDREYVSGQDSLPTSEEEQSAKRTKKAPSVKVATKPPTTRSKTAQKAADEGKQVNDEVAVPPPPQLPSTLQELKQIKRAYNNDGVGTMEAFVKMRQSLKEKEQEAASNAEDNDAGVNKEPTDGKVPAEGETKVARRRGPTKMSSVFTRKLEERPHLILNHELQPVHEDSKIRSEFGSFLGTIGRQCVPLDYVNWSRVPETEKNGWWEFVKTKYVIPEEGKDWVLKTICDAWRMYKSRFKAEYYTKYDNDEERLKRRPQSIPLEKFKILLQYWGDEKIKSTAAKNANNRRRVIDTHTAGRTSFAQIRNDMKKVQSTPDTPTKADIYPKTRKGHEKKTTKNAEGNDNEEEADADVDAEDKAEEAAKTIVEIDFAAHGPNWLVGRSGRTSKTRNITTHESRKAEELATLRKEIAAEMEDKLNKKLKTILEHLAEKNPSLHINVDELCASGQSEESEDESDAAADS